MKTKPLFLILFALFSMQIMAQNWPAWRGQNFDGVARLATPPTKWSETENVKWKTPIPGKGLGTPVIWEDQIFITTAIELDQQATEEAIRELKKSTPNIGKIMGMSQTTENFMRFVVYSIDKNTGEIIWQKTVREQYPHEGVHSQNSWASASCVTDGEHVIAHFGSFGTFGFDMAGNLLWEKDFGNMSVEMAFGEGTSPVLYDDKVAIVWDHKQQSNVYVLNKVSGEPIWVNNRDEETTWATPLVVEVDNVPQLIVPGKLKTIAYNLNNGAEIWTLTGLGQDIIPSPVYDGTKVFLMCGFQASKIKVIQAVELEGAKGSLDSTAYLKWTHNGNTSYVPSPLLSRDKIYFLKGARAQISCIDAKTGKIYYEAVRPDGAKGAYASPVSANGMVYFIDRAGMCHIIKEGEIFELVAQNILDDGFDASPVAIGNDLFLRGYKNLYCISE